MKTGVSVRTLASPGFGWPSSAGLNDHLLKAAYPSGSPQRAVASCLLLGDLQISLGGHAAVAARDRAHRRRLHDRQGIRRRGDRCQRRVEPDGVPTQSAPTSPTYSPCPRCTPRGWAPAAARRPPSDWRSTSPWERDRELPVAGSRPRRRTLGGRQGDPPRPRRRLVQRCPLPSKRERGEETFDYRFQVDQNGRVSRLSSGRGSPSRHQARPLRLRPDGDERAGLGGSATATAGSTRHSTAAPPGRPTSWDDDEAEEAAVTSRPARARGFRGPRRLVVWGTATGRSSWLAPARRHPGRDRDGEGSGHPGRAGSAPRGAQPRGRPEASLPARPTPNPEDLPSPRETPPSRLRAHRARRHVSGEERAADVVHLLPLELRRPRGHRCPDARTSPRA